MGTSHPTAPQSTRAVTVGCGGYGSGFGAPRAAGARALFWAWPNSARHRVWPRPGGSCRCTKVGVPQYPNLCTGSCSFPRQGLLRARRRPSCSLLNHSRTKYTRHKTETPARGACREGRTRLKTAPLTQDPGKRSLLGRLEDTPRRYMRPGKGPGSGKLPGPARSRPRQGACREGCAVCPRSSSSAHASPWGLSRDAWRMAVQPGGHGGTPRW